MAKKRGQRMQGSLVVLPLPFFAALLCVVLSALAARMDLGRRISSLLFAALFVVFALEAVMVGLRFGYDVQSFILVQGILPLSVGPLIYLGFVSLSASPDRVKQLALRHFGGALCTGVLAVILPLRYVPLDWVISGSYLFYALMLLRLWRVGSNALIHARLDLARGIMRLMLGAVGLLLLMCLIDTAIATSFALRNEAQAVALVSLGSMLLIFVLVLMFLAVPRFLYNAATPARSEPLGKEDAVRLEAAARDLLTGTQLYLDPDLTVQRLAKRLHVPTRSLSAAINETQGKNLSQYVNGFRLEHAASLLRNSEASVAQVMAQSGFLTRSNFYREFQRVFGQAPAAYRQGVRDDPP